MTVYTKLFIPSLKDLFLKWLGPKCLTSSSGLKDFTRYLNMVRQASLLYILNFSLQRTQEVISLRTDCFYIENDDHIGQIALIIGETTKTDPDSDARWVVPITAKKGVDAAASVAHLRSRFLDSRQIQTQNQHEPLPLSLSSIEPWSVLPADSSFHISEVISPIRYEPFLSAFPEFFNPKEIEITEADWKEAISMTPNLANKSKFAIGLPWRFGAHQLRRTLCINMFGSNMVSDNSIQWLMKHLTPQMTFYYGRNYSNLKMNSEVETLLLVESYKSISYKLQAIVNDKITFIRPHGREFITDKTIGLINDKDEKQLLNLIKDGEVNCRQTLLGFCMKAGSCEYGGIESVVKCANGDGGGICSDAIFSRKNESELIAFKNQLENKLLNMDSSSPKYKSLKQEILAIGVYFNVLNN